MEVRIRDGWMYGHYEDGPFITEEMRQAMASGPVAALTEQRMAADPFFAEDIESIHESMPFIIDLAGAGRPVRCECCGTRVWDPLEAHSGEPRRWTRAIWEPETGRKHTLRRCNWHRDQATADPSPHR